MDRKPRRASPVFVAEPNGLLRAGIEHVLSRSGYPVAAFEDGDAALAAALGEVRPLLLIGAVRLPGLDGMSLVRTLRARWPGLPAILLAEGGLEREQWWRGLPLPCAVLEKPVSQEVLLAVARRFAPQPARARATQPAGRLEMRA